MATTEEVVNAVDTPITNAEGEVFVDTSAADALAAQNEADRLAAEQAEADKLAAEQAVANATTEAEAAALANMDTTVNQTTTETDWWSQYGTPYPNEAAAIASGFF